MTILWPYKTIWLYKTQLDHYHRHMPIKDPEKRRVYQREYMRKWYEKNRSRHIAYVRNRDRKIKEWLKAYRLTQSCVQCGEDHPACLDFHHIDPASKKFAIGRLEHYLSLKLLQDEIAKCEVLCSNCHRKLHWNEEEKV